MSETQDSDDELIAAVTAGLQEDEQFARQASQAPWRCEDNFVENLDGGMIARFEIKANARFVASNDPLRMLREVAATRELLDQYQRVLRSKVRHAAALAEWKADVEHEERTGQWAGAGDPGTRSRALLREGDYLIAMEPVLRSLLVAKAAVWTVDDS